MTLAEAQKIVQDYGAVMEERVALGVIRDVNSLPYPKDKIKEALLFALRANDEPVIREHLRVGYILLADFQKLSDAQIKSLQSWNKALARKTGEMTLDELRDEARAMSVIGDDAIAIQAKSANEMEVLMAELKGAGF